MAAANSPLLVSPERAPSAFAEALNAGRLEVAAGCFSRDACLMAPGATAIHGREEIRSLLSQMIAQGSRIEIVQSTVTRAGEVALARQRWTLSSAAPDQERYQQSLSPTVVLRRIEGEWKLAIVIPWDRRSFVT